MDPIALRAIERIVDVMIGGLSVYLGYLLFLNVPHQSDSKGNLNLPGGIHVYLTRVGPGVFFALFGTVVVGASLYHGITASEEPIHYIDTVGSSQGGSSAKLVSTKAPGTVVYSGMVSDSDLLANPEASRVAVERQVAALNGVGSALRTDVAASQKDDLMRSIPQIKLALMKSVWANEWGDRAIFENWVIRGAPDPVPAGLEKGAACYRRGESLSRTGSSPRASR
jgi:hypothetical protein